MGDVPLYLLVYYLEIRKHAEEVGYLERRFRGMDLTRAADEKVMIEELVDLHLIAVTEQEVDVTYNPLIEQLGPGHFAYRVGRESTLAVPKEFIILARGRYVWTELLARFVGWLVTALVCGFAGGLAFDAKGDHLDAWVVAVACGLCLAAFVCGGLVATTPKAKR